MKVYIDLILILNFVFDFLLLTTVCYILKRNVKVKQIFFGALIGSVSTLFLFLKLSNFKLFLYKIILSVLMIFVTFGYKNFKYFITNISYLYLSSIVLGGGLYLINNEFNFKSYNFLFINNGYRLNIFIIILLSPILLFLYIKQLKKLKYNHNNYHRVEVNYNENKYYFTAFLDTGNKLKDQYKNRPIILVRTDKIVFDYEKGILVPYETIDGVGLLKCVKASKIIIDNENVLSNVLIGLSEKDFNIDGVDMLLNSESL